MRAVTATRYALTASLLYGAYTETGVWTALVLSLVVIQGEMVAVILRKRR